VNICEKCDSKNDYPYVIKSDAKLLSAVLESLISTVNVVLKNNNGNDLTALELWKKISFIFEEVQQNSKDKEFLLFFNKQIQNLNF
jgi:hypothetical protein